MSPSPVLACQGLERSFGSLRAVQGVNFEVSTGETYGLLGPNGAGKTTTISMIAGLLEPDAGSVHVAGMPMGPRHHVAKRAVGLVPQELAIYPDLTGRENLEFFARLYRMEAESRRTRVDEVLEVIGLTDRAGDRTGTYSGGMQRRLNIGIGLLHRPTLLILDEPTVGVDPQSRNAILASVEALAGEGMSVVYTTHYMEEAERLCDRIAIIDEGRIVAEGARRELVGTLGTSDLVRLEVTGDAAVAAEACRGVDGVERADAEATAVVCLVDHAAARLAGMLGVISQRGVDVVGVEVREPDLEDVFLHLTGKALRD